MSNRDPYSDSKERTLLSAISCRKAGYRLKKLNVWLRQRMQSLVKASL